MARQNINPAGKKASEVLAELREAKNSGNYDELSREAKEIAKSLGKDNVDGGNINELIAEIDTEIRIDEEITVEKLIEVINQEKSVVEDSDDKLSSKVPDRILLEQLLKELDDAELKKGESGVRKEVERLGKRKEYAGVIDQIQKAIEKKIEIQREVETKLASKQISEKQKEIIADKISDRLVVNETAFQDAETESIRKVNENILENIEVLVVSNESDLRKSAKSIQEANSKISLRNDIEKEINESLIATAAEIYTEKVIEVESVKIVGALDKTAITAETKEAIRQIVEKRVKEVFKGNLVAVEADRVEVVDDSLKAVIKLEDEIANVVENDPRIGNKEAISKDITIKLRAILENPGAKTITTPGGGLEVIPSASINDEIVQIKKENADIVAVYRRSEIIREASQTAFEAWNKGEISSTEAEGAYEAAKITAELVYPDGEFIRTESEIPKQYDKGKEVSKIIGGMIRSPTKISDQIEKVQTAANKSGKIFNRLPSEVKTLERVTGELAKNKTLQEFYERVRKFTVAKRKAEERAINWAISHGQAIATSLGINTSAEAFKNMAFIASGGLSQQALWAVGHQIMSGTLPATIEAVSTAYTAGGFMGATTQAFTSLGLLETPAGATALSWIGKAHANVVGWGAKVAAKSPGLAKLGSSVAKPIGNGLGKLLVNGGKWASKVVPAVAGKLAAGVGAISQALVALPGLIGGAIASILPIIAIVVVAVFIGILVIMIFNGMQNASVVPPPLENVNCVKVEKDETEEESGNINCNQALEEKNVPGVDRENFFRIADQWKGGKNYARECFNDVVCRARSAGVDEAFALWVWVHESGASNYSINDVEDFGIHGQSSVPTKNFNAQINYFMSLSHGNACPGLDFWLGWSTRYLTGGCDPDKVVGNDTGRTYLAAIQQQYNWITSKPLPAQIKKRGTGESCGDAGESEDEGYTYIDENGDTWMCKNEPALASTGSGLPLPTRDPNQPVPDGCPDIWPLTTAACINQGPYGGYSHKVIEALDFGGGCLGKNLGGAEIVATHDGIARYGGGEGSAYGYFVDVTSTCNGKEITTRYAHLAGLPTFGQNSEVKKGQVLGVVNNSGTFRSPGNEHLHYEILQRALPINQYIPATSNPIISGCSGWANCGSNIINN